MATTNPIVSSITGFTYEQNDKLLSKSILGARSSRMFNLQTGVKGRTALNIMDTEVVFGDGSNCGWDESGTTTYSQRMLEPKALKVNMAFCDKKLLATWAQYKVRVAAGLATLPFEEYWVNQIVDSVNAKVEKMTYQGASGQDNEFEGLISILDTASASTKNVSSASGTSAYNFIKAVAAAIPVEVKNPVILVSTALYREYMQDLVAANLYHYNPGDGENEYKLPGTDIRVIGVDGLNGTSTYDYAIGANLNNLFYGCDMEGDEDIFDLWYSQDNREFRLAIEFVAGVQVAFPAEVAYGKRVKA